MKQLFTNENHLLAMNSKNVLVSAGILRVNRRRTRARWMTVGNNLASTTNRKTD
jgi:hypothetical protein